MSAFRVVFALILAISLVGCGRGKVSMTASQAANPSGVTPDEILVSATIQLRPDNFGINSTTDKPVSLLNSWRTKRNEQSGAEDKPTPPKAPEGWISEAEKEQLQQVRFESVDAEHVRDAMLFHTIAGFISDRAKDESLRVNSVIEFVCRNVAFWKDDETALPTNSFMTLQFGRGRVEDRASICADILRQLRIDTLVLRIKSDSKEATDKWLLGAIVDKKIRLYDLLLGAPVFGGSAEESAPAVTLDELLKHPEFLEQMSTSEPYRLTIDDLKEAVPYVVSTPYFWAYRMYSLEQALPAKDACVLYDPLLGEDDKPGVVQRVAAAGGWPVDAVKLFGLPARNRELSKQPNESIMRQFQRIVAPFQVPVSFKPEADGKFTIGASENKMLRYRMDQLLGKFTEATQRYLSIRHLEVEANPPELIPLIRLASEDAFFWTCLCKVELEDYQAATDMLLSYLKKYDRSGKWYFAARVQVAQCYAKQGKIGEAIKTLERMSSDDPFQPANALQVKRWTAKAK